MHCTPNSFFLQISIKIRTHLYIPISIECRKTCVHIQQNGIVNWFLVAHQFRCVCHILLYFVIQFLLYYVPLCMKCVNIMYLSNYVALNTNRKLLAMNWMCVCEKTQINKQKTLSSKKNAKKAPNWKKNQWNNDNFSYEYEIKLK